MRGVVIKWDIIVIVLVSIVFVYCAKTLFFLGFRKKNHIENGNQREGMERF